MRFFIRLPPLAAAMLILLAALWAALLRLGWAVPDLPGGALVHHGALMVSGFLGSLISLERAVALEQRWPHAAPLLSALGGLALLLGLPAAAGQVLVLLGSLAFTAVALHILRRQRQLFNATLLAGACLWAGGNLLWLLGEPLGVVVPWWAGYLVLTIAGERLELTRVLGARRGRGPAFVVAAGLLALGLLTGLAAPAAGARLAGAGLLALSLWLWRYDIARRTVRQGGLTRFMAVCLLGGYAWLGLAGVLALVYGPLRYGLVYDAWLHALFLGFVISMVFGHAPVIFPAVLRRPLPFRRSFYLHVGLLHASLALRVAADLSGALALRRWGGLLNVVAVLLFVLVTAAAVARGEGPAARSGSDRAETC